MIDLERQEENSGKKVGPPSTHAPPAIATLRLHVEAIRNARGRQLAARALRPINRRRTRSSRMPRAFRPVGGPVVDLWRSAAFSMSDRVAERLPDGELDLLGHSVAYPTSDWSGAGLEGLRRFHLHYGDEILGCARRGDERYLDAARAGLAAWIDSNPPAARPSWHPYPLSTRVGNWIAAASLEPSLASAAVSASLWRQLAYLERNIENDILGNHVIRNARALVLGGVAFGAERLLARGLDLLTRELPEQILSDGGHYERSPVYHALVLRDLLEIRAAAGTSELDLPIERMKRFAAWLSRPNGGPALFNDGGVDLAPDLRDLLPQSERGLALFQETGYAVVRDDQSFWLAFDCGLAAPPFLPPHAHADALSFQLWVGGTPVVVDPATFTYEAGCERNWFRSTSAHATVAVDGADQFQFVGAFRALGIPPVQIVEVSGSEREGTIAAEFDGFRQVVGGVKHRRRLSWSPAQISVEDWIDGDGSHVLESALPLAPGVELQQGGALRAAGVEIEPIGPLDCAVEDRWVSERFFERAPAPAVVVRGQVKLPVTIGWELRLPDGASTCR
jgi:hypothetical protein